VRERAAAGKRRLTGNSRAPVSGGPSLGVCAAETGSQPARRSHERRKHEQCTGLVSCFVADRPSGHFCWCRSSSRVPEDFIRGFRWFRGLVPTWDVRRPAANAAGLGAERTAWRRVTRPKASSSHRPFRTHRGSAAPPDVHESRNGPAGY